MVRMLVQTQYNKHNNWPKYDYLIVTHLVLNVNCFKPFKVSFKKERNNNMVRNNYNEPDKATFASQVDKALDLALSKRNIKNGFQVTRIWLINSKAMDGRTKPNELDTTNHNNDTSN